MKKRNIISIILCATIAIQLLTGCGAGTEAETSTPSNSTVENAEVEDTADSVNVGFANINEKTTFGKLVKMGFEEACEKRGWTLTYVDNNSDGQTAVTNAEILANNQVDFVVDLNVDQSVADSILEILNNADIPVLAVDIALGDSPFFGMNSQKVGELSGEYGANYIKENWDGEVDYVVLMTQIASGDEVQKRVYGALDSLEAAGIKVGAVEEIEAQGDTSTAQSMFASFLTAHPDAKKIAVFTINENPATGVQAATITAGREDEVKIFGAGSGAQFVEPLYEAEGDLPWLASVAQFPENYGEQICQIIEEYMETGKMEKQYDCELISVDWSNIKDYYPEGNWPWTKVE